MRFTKRLFLILGMLSSSYALSQNADAITGIWLTEDEDARIKIYRSGNEFLGKVVWMVDSLDAQGNPIRDDRGKKVMNMQVMEGFRFEDGEYVDGTIYDPEKGNTYYASMYLENKNTLKLKGSLDQFGILGKTQTWQRIKSSP